MSSAAPALPGVDPERQVFPVAEYVRRTGEWIGRLPAIWVDGEIREIKARPNWGLVYFSLYDRESTPTVSLPCSMPRLAWEQLAGVEDGLHVHVLGRGRLLARRGQFQFQVTRVDPYGIGQLLAALEERRRRLDSEGLFALERKRRLPFLPATIGVICGRDADAERDLVAHVRKRLPSARFRTSYALVQGSTSPAQVRRALATLDGDPEVDVIVITRGGGSAEDLAGFSDEGLCRAIAASGTPVVSAIGHERDQPICDLVADARASTPTDAAKLVVPEAHVVADDLGALLRRVRRAADGTVRERGESLRAAVAPTAISHPGRLLGDRDAALFSLRRRHAQCSPERLLSARLGDQAVLRRRLRSALGSTIVSRSTILSSAGGRLAGRDPATWIPALTATVDGLLRRGRASAGREVSERRVELDAVARHGRSVSPRATLDRGYSIVLGPDGHVLASSETLATGDEIAIRFARGRAEATVTRTEADHER